MRLPLAPLAIGLLSLSAAACQAPAGGPSDAATGPCTELDEAACLARADCHAAYQVDPCENVFGYCAAYLRCDDDQANCLGPANCDILQPFCAGPYVNSYTPTCYGPCVRADQCAGCQDAKMSFTMADGCANDGGVEFCIPPELQPAIALIAPTVTCAPGGGRAGCDPTTQLLCQFPTDATTCTAPHGALTDDAWDTLCGISMLPDVTAIVPTILE